jgi:hypothetical protein
MSATMKDHVSAGAIRRMLERPGLKVTEEWATRSGRISAATALGEPALEVELEKTDDGRIRCTVIDFDQGSRRRETSVTYWYRDRDVSSLDKHDRRTIESASILIRAIVSRHERRPEPEPASDVLAERIRDLIAADPEGAPERVAEAIANAVRPDQASEIADGLTIEPAYRG